MKELWEPLPPQLRDSFPNFTCYLLRELGLADAPTKQQISVCQWMQEGPDKSLTVAFRGLGKSILASFYALWRLRVDPNEKILIVSATAVKSTDFSSFMLRCIGEIDILQCLMPGTENRFSNVAFDVGPAQVEQSPSVRSMGIMGQTTGQRCTCAILDDVETLANVITQLKQDRVAHAVEEIQSIIKPEEGQVLPRKILYLGTPHTETSIYLRLVRERNYAARYWPALYPDELDCYEGNLDPTIEQEVFSNSSLVKQPTDPERFGHEDILQRQASMTKASFELQFMLNTRLATLDKFPIRLGDLMVVDLDGTALPETCVWSNQPDVRLQELVCVGLGADRYYHRPIFQNGWIPKSDTWRCVLAIDPAGRGADELAWAVVAELNGNMFLLESGGSTLGYADEVLQYLAKTAKKWEVNYVVAESNMGDGMFTALLKPHLLREYPVTIEEVRHNIRKEQRLCDTLGPLIQQHRLIVNSRVIKQDYRLTDEDPEHGYARSLFFQASRLTAERGCLSHDDRLDALAIACGFFVESAAQDQEKAKKSRADQLFEDELEAWMDETVGSIDSIAMGWGGRKSRGKVHGGVQRLQVGVSKE
jgi:hypothetical protein